MDTYTATLAAKSFWTMMAIAAKWNLTIWQLDAVSAFTNNVLEELVYAYYPDRYKQNRYCLQLIRALYGLR
jgi:hypothetical protein